MLVSSLRALKAIWFGHYPARVSGRRLTSKEPLHSFSYSTLWKVEAAVVLCQMALIYDRASFGSRLVYDRVSLGSRLYKGNKARYSAVSQRKGLHALAIHAAKELQLLRVLYNECFWLFPLLLVLKGNSVIKWIFLSLGDIQSLHNRSSCYFGTLVQKKQTVTQ